MKVGDYVRTPYGIRKVKSIAKHDKYQDDGFYVEDRFIVCGKEAMKEIKSSSNIIDLIQVGDYVNGLLIKSIGDKFYNCGHTLVYFKDIKSIVTKEQFESIEYKVGE